MNECYEFEEISTPKSPSNLRKKKRSQNDSSRSPLREKRSVRWEDEEAPPFEIQEEDEENIKPSKPAKVVKHQASLDEMYSTDSQKAEESSINSNK